MILVGATPVIHISTTKEVQREAEISGNVVWKLASLMHVTVRVKADKPYLASDY